MRTQSGRVASLAALVPLLALGCREPVPEVPRGPASIAGYVTAVTPGDGGGGSIRVERDSSTESGEPKAVVFVTPSTTIIVPSAPGEVDFRVFAVGQWVRVWYTGPVRESYPVQADAATIVVDSVTAARGVPASNAFVAASALPADSAALGARARIDAYVAQVDRELPTYRCRTLELWGYSAEGGELRACSVDDELRFLHARYLGETGRAEDHFYFQDDELVFVFGSGEPYTTPLSGVARTREEERLWFADGQLVRWIGPDGAAPPPSSAEAREQAAEYQALVREFLACLRDAAATECEK